MVAQDIFKISVGLTRVFVSYLGRNQLNVPKYCHGVNNTSISFLI